MVDSPYLAECSTAHPTAQQSVSIGRNATAVAYNVKTGLARTASRGGGAVVVTPSTRLYAVESATLLLQWKRTSCPKILPV